MYASAGIRIYFKGKQIRVPNATTTITITKNNTYYVKLSQEILLKTKQNKKKQNGKNKNNIFIIS